LQRIGADQVNPGQLVTSVWALWPWRKLSLTIVQRAIGVQDFYHLIKIIFEDAAHRFPTTSVLIGIRISPDIPGDFYALPR
jgi:hypothetical protein